MLSELRCLLESVPPEASHDDYLRAIREDNILGKRTSSNRDQTAQRLTELYALDPAVTLFRLLRRFWNSESSAGGGRPLLAILCVLSRDPLLRATAGPVLGLDPGDEFPRLLVVETLREELGMRMNDATIDKVARNAASSWTQSGHLAGRVFKRRARVAATPLAVAYALLLGYLLGQRGKRLFHTLWVKALDASENELVSLAGEAKRLGILDLKHSGDVTEVGFPHLLTRQELELSHGTD
ncbi:MAG: hypothetical protein HY717_08815 [Planctomycetes bacterium]|nr:hypothetical protein [Planctomycetota bacterium]